MQEHQKVGYCDGLVVGDKVGKIGIAVGLPVGISEGLGLGEGLGIDEGIGLGKEVVGK
jgi:hypothetical protein